MNSESDTNALALDRTALANERTYAAWIRTGLAFLVTGLGIDRFLSDSMPFWAFGLSNFEWTELDTRAVDTARILAVDAVQKTGNGHPGTAMSLAPAVYLIFQKFLRHDPSDPNWIGRDRFVMSNGHSSLTLYTELFYAAAARKPLALVQG